MIKATARGDDGIMVFLGLSFMNLHRLQEGQPIIVDLAEMGLPADERPSKILLHAGKNEQAIITELRAHGVKLYDAENPPPQ